MTSTLFNMVEARWMMVVAGILMAALVARWTACFVSDVVQQRGRVKAILFVAMSVSVTFWAGGKGGGDRGAVVVQSPDVCDIGEADWLSHLPIVSNLTIAAILRGSNETANVVAWRPSSRPLGDFVDFYGGTNLTCFEKLFTLDVAQCASNALVVVTDAEVSGTNFNTSAFFSVGDATDSDGDGISDSDERLLYKTNPAMVDTDGDGLDDGREVALGACPLSADSDGDGLSDGEETGYIRMAEAFEWYDSEGWTTEYGCDPYAWLNGDGIGSPRYPSIFTSLAPQISFYDTSLTWMFAYQCGYVSFFASGSFAYNFDPWAPSPLNGWASNCGNFLVVPYWMSSDLEIGNTNSFMRHGYVASNGVHVVEYRNLMKRDTDFGVTMQVIIPADSNRTVRISYLSSDLWLDGEDAVVGVQNKDIITADGYYNLTYDFSRFGPILPQTTWEYRLGYATNPISSDTDGDGLPDDFEIGVLHSDPLSADGDGDGLTDVQEYVIGTNPKLSDSDGDSLPDGWEVMYELDPLSSEGNQGMGGDIDNDGLTNYQEYRNGTNPRLADTDNDGLSDSEEILLGTNPCLADTDGDGVGDEDEIDDGTDPCNPDSDCDGLSDGQENSIHTNPLQPDTDMDGMNDGWEYQHLSAGFDPLVDNATDANVENDVNADPDGDGLTNGQECELNTNPSGQDVDNDGIADGYDTDGDGVGDGTEVAQNSDPGDATDGGLPNSRISVPFTFGDPSGSVSEKYRLEILPVSGVGDTPRSFLWLNEAYGECETKTAMLKPGWKYEVRLHHAGTSPTYNGTPKPDYDYALTIAGSLPHNVILDDPSSLFGTNENSVSFAGAGKVTTVSVYMVIGVAICKPDDSSWAELEESRVVLDDEPLRIKIEIAPCLQSLAQCTQIFGESLTIRTAGTCPAGAAISLVGNSTVSQLSGKSEVRISRNRQQLILLGLLPSNNDDGVNEMAWLDMADMSPLSNQNTLDSEAFAALAFESRGSACRDPALTLDSDPPNSMPTASYFKAAGREIVVAAYQGVVSPRRQIMNQADYFYFSGHGYHNDNFLYSGFVGGFTAAMATNYWGRDLDCVVIAACSVLDINDYNGNTDALSAQLSPGKAWERTGPSTLLGYNYSAPRDDGGAPVRIARSWVANREAKGDVDAWMDANAANKAWNACAIVKDEKYVYFASWLGLRRRKEVKKENW